MSAVQDMRRTGRRRNASQCVRAVCTASVPPQTLALASQAIREIAVTPVRDA
jgi:hypothetical protein